MKWLTETRGVKFELVRHFARRMFDSELSSTPGHLQNLVIGLIAFALPCGVILLDPSYALKYRRLSALPSADAFRAAQGADQVALITMLCVITGLVALLQWQSLLPTRRDIFALAALPVRPRQLFAARFAAVLLFSIALVVAVNILPSLVVPRQFAGRWQINPSYFANVRAQAAACGLSCFFVFFSIVALQGVLITALPRRLFARASVYAQAALISLLLFAGLRSWSASGADSAGAESWYAAGWSPVVWFVALREYLAGDLSPLVKTLAWRAMPAAAAAFLLALGAYVVAYRRHSALLIEAPEQITTPPLPRWSVLRFLGRTPRQEAIIDFATKTLARSRTHRLVLLAYLASTIGILPNSSLVVAAIQKGVSGWRQTVEFAGLLWPLAASFTMLAGVRHVFSLPAELRANWTFQAVENEGRAEWMRAVEKFVVGLVIVPIYLLLFPLNLAVHSWALALRIASLQILVSLTVFELMFYGWQKLPFTCSYIPGKQKPVVLLATWIGLLGFLVPILSIILATVSAIPSIFFITLVPFAAVWLWARRQRVAGWGSSKLIFEDVGDAMPELGIKDIAPGAWHALDS